MGRLVDLVESGTKNNCSVDTLCAKLVFNKMLKNTTSEMIKNGWNHTKILTPTAATVNVP